MNPTPGFEEKPRIVIWEVTRACALACLHCRADAQERRDPRELSTAEGFALIDSLAPLKPLLILTGGDPMERLDLTDLVERGVSRGMTVALSPSATPRATPERLWALKRAGLHRVALSLDGPDAATHDAFRGVKGVFDRTVALAAGLRSIGLPLQFGTTVTTHNADRLEEIGALVERLGAVVWSVFFLVPTGRAGRERQIRAEQAEAILEWLAGYSTRVRFGIKTTEAPMYRRVAARVAGRIAFTGINDAKGFVFVSHIGEVMPSGFLPIPAGNVRDAPLLDLYRDAPLFRALRDPARLKGKCGACEYRSVCGGSRARAYAMTGDPLESDPLCAYVPAAAGGIMTAAPEPDGSVPVPGAPPRMSFEAKRVSDKRD